MYDNDSIAIITDSGELCSYNELINQSERFANYIDNRCVVAFLTSNYIECIVGYIGCLKHRIVPMLLSEKIYYTQLKMILDNYKPSYIWMPEKYKDNFIDYELIYRMDSYVLIKLNNLNVKLNNNLALLLSTSGSTGSSKFVRISYENIQSNTESIIKSLGIKKDDKAITVLPFNYTYGLSVVNTHLYVGATILLTNEPIYKNEFWDFFNKYNGTSFSGVPYIYEMLVKLRLMHKFPESVRMITQAGGKLNISYQKKISEYVIENNIEFYIMYGQTEATARITCMRLDNDMNHIGSIGKFIYGVNGEVSDDGELIIYGKNVSMGYAKNIENLSRDDDNKGILNTGDIVIVDKMGYIYWKGRKDRYKKILGNRINLDELDENLNNKYERNEFISNIIENKIIINTNYNGDKEIIDYVSQITKFNRKLFIINRVNEFPRKENGKINYLILLNKNIDKFLK